LYLSPAGLAETLGLSVSTLKRWTDKGLLKVERTVGGHRRIALDEAVRFVRDSGLKPVMPHRLGLAAPASGRAATDPGGFVTELLVSGRSEDARRFLVSAFAAGEDAGRIGDDWLRPAFEELGRLWKHGPEGIAFEHQATDAALRSIAEMRALVQAPEGAPTAVGGAAAGDPYLIPSALAGLVLAVNGFRTANLGGDLPRAALLAITERFKPRLVWISVSVVDNDEGKRPALEDLAARLCDRGAAVVVGGRAAPDRVKGATVCKDLAALSAFARGLLA
jgi:excisionase family DNA binding protein